MCKQLTGENLHLNSFGSGLNLNSKYLILHKQTLRWTFPLLNLKEKADSHRLSKLLDIFQTLTSTSSIKSWVPVCIQLTLQLIKLPPDTWMDSFQVCSYIFSKNDWLLSAKAEKAVVHTYTHTHPYCCTMKLNFEACQSRYDSAIFWCTF